MTTNQTAQVVTVALNAGIAIITIDYPPVNALSQQVRVGLINAINELENNHAVRVIILRCQGKTFIAGADIKEFGKPATEPYLPDVVNRIENCSKPVIAAMFGTSLGGGFEVALSCHYRIALASAKVGLPEVNLGLIPGAGGTQRLMRLVGPEKALEMITSGRHYQVNSFVGTPLIDSVVDDDLTQNKHTTTESVLDKHAINFAEQLINANKLLPSRVGEIKVNSDGFDYSLAKKQVMKKARGQAAPLVAFDVLEKTKEMTITDGMAYEREQFLALRSSAQSAALIYAFGAEKKANKINYSASPLNVQQVGIIGGGNMGSGIATCFLSANFSVQLIEQSSQALEAGLARIKSNFAHNVKRGGISQWAADNCLAKLSGSVEYQTLADCDLVVEAVFEDIDVKKQLFNKLTTICKPTAILATNTSYLDINTIAAATLRPEQVVGMHFFSPANIMKLLEVVQADKTSEQVIVSAMHVAKRLKKVAVLVNVCFGFASNRMYTRYGREVQQMLLEGAEIEQIDKALTQWGFAMGPLAVQDLSGIDIGHNARSAREFPSHDKGYFRAAATLVGADRLGRKTCAGFYDYNEQGKPELSAKAAQLIKEKGMTLGFEQRSFTDEEIVTRALLALISEGCALMAEGIVQRMSDIDVIWLHGYGFPRFKGGPMFQAQVLGHDKIKQQLTEVSAGLTKEIAEQIWPTIDLSLFKLKS